MAHGNATSGPKTCAAVEQPIGNASEAMVQEVVEKVAKLAHAPWRRWSTYGGEVKNMVH